MAIVSVCLNLTACSSNDEKEDDFTAKGQITGKLEKGPFLQGSKVILYELNNNLSQTGDVYKRQVFITVKKRCLMTNIKRHVTSGINGIKELYKA